MPSFEASDVDSREALVAEENSEAAREMSELFRSFMDLCDTEEAAPSAGLRIHTEKVVSAPDGNTINLQVIRPDSDEALACVYYMAWRHSRATTGCTAGGGSSSRPTASPLSRSTFAIRSWLPRCPRSRHSPRD